MSRSSGARHETHLDNPWLLLNLADLVEARPAGGLDEHHIAGGEVAAQPVDGRVVVGQHHRPLSRAVGDRPGDLADRDQTSAREAAYSPTARCSASLSSPSSRISPRTAMRRPPSIAASASRAARVESGLAL